MPQSRDAGIFLTGLNQGESFFQLRRSSLAPIRETLQDLVVAFNCLRVIASPKVHFREIEIRIARQVSVRIILYIVTELLLGQVDIAAVVVA